MATQTELLPPDVPMPLKVVPVETDDWTYGLQSIWPRALDLAGSNLPCRLEGEIESLVSSALDEMRLIGAFLTIVLGGTRSSTEGDQWLVLQSHGRPFCAASRRERTH